MALSNKKSSRVKPGSVPAKFHVKRGDTVMVTAGKDKGKTGTVKMILTDKGKVVVEGLNLVKKAVRPNPMAGQRGGLIEVEAALHVSNVMVYDLKSSKATRVKRDVVEGKRVRVSVKSGEKIDA